MTVEVLVSLSMPWGKDLGWILLTEAMFNALALIALARHRRARPFILLGLAALLFAGMWQADAPRRACESQGPGYSYSYMEGCSD